MQKETQKIFFACTTSNKYGEGGVIQILTVFGPPYHVACWKTTEMGLFRHLLNHILGIL